MASPYFSNINVQQADYSPLVQAGAAVGNMYSNMGATIANTISEVGNAYFDKKKAENALNDFLKKPEGQKYLQDEYGYTPEQVSDMLEKGTLPKEISKVMKDVGIDKIMDRQKSKMQLQQSEEKHRATMEQLNLANEQSAFVIDQLKQQKKINDYRNDYLAHTQTKNKDGVKYSQTLDPAKGYFKEGEEIDPLNMQAVREVNQSLGLGKYSPAMLTAIVDDFRKEDMGGTGELLKSVNFKSQAAFEESWNEFTSKNPNLPKEQLTAARARLQDLVVPTGEVRKIIDKSVAASGFGSFIETMKTQKGTMGNFRALLDEALTGVNVNEDGKTITWGVSNAAAASVALMQLARMAQGAGVLSDKDVDRIKGSRLLSSRFKRFFDKTLGEEQKVTQEMLDGTYGNAINPETGEVFKLGDPVVTGGAELNAADLLEFRKIADRLDARGDELQKKVIPQILDEVRANYGGLSTNEILEFTDLDLYYDPSTQMPDQPKLAGVTTAHVNSALNGFKRGMSREAITNIVTSNTENYNPAVHDPMIKMALDQAEEQFKSGGSKIELKQKNLVNPASYKNPNLNDQGSAFATTSALASGTAGTLATNRAMNTRDLGKFQSLPTGEQNKFPLTKAITDTKNQIDTGSFTDLKKIAKQEGIPTDQYKGLKSDEKALRKKLNAKIKSRVQTRLAKWAATQGFSHGLKKKLVAGVAGLFSGVAGLTFGSVIFDVIAMADAEQDATESEMNELIANAKTEEDKDLLKRMRDEYLNKIAKTKPRFEAGQYQGLGSRGFGR